MGFCNTTGVSLTCIVQAKSAVALSASSVSLHWISSSMGSRQAASNFYDVYGSYFGSGHKSHTPMCRSRRGALYEHIGICDRK